MPTKTFFNLSEGKRSRLILAAMEEFSKYSLNEASINAIIKKADISRGSFYQYFENKEDFYFYLAKNVKTESERLFKEEIEKAQGDLIVGVRHFFPKFLTMMLEDPNANFFKQLFLNMDYKASKEITPEELKKHQEGQKNRNGISSIDLSLFQLNSQEELNELSQLIIAIMVREITEGFAGDYTQDQMMGNFYRKLNWIECGVRKKK